MSFLQDLGEKIGAIFGYELVEEPQNNLPAEPPLPVLVRDTKDKKSPNKTDEEKPVQKMSIVFVEPKKYLDCPVIAAKLKEGKSVIVNYSFLESTDAKKIFYFLLGFSYASDGSHQKIASNIYLYTPPHVGIHSHTKSIAPSLEDTLRLEWDLSLEA